jgi:hypothetical protein
MSDSPISQQVSLSGFRASALARRIANRLSGSKAGSKAGSRAGSKAGSAAADSRRSLRAEKARSRRARPRTSPRLGPRVGSPSAAFRPYQETAGRSVVAEPSRERFSITRGDGGYLLHVRNSQVSAPAGQGRISRRRRDGWLVYD